MSKSLKKFLVVLPLAALALGVSGCGEDEPPRDYAATNSAGAQIKTKNSELGTILVDASGRTLYVFSKDEENESNCVDACPGAWPPATVSGKVVAGGEAEQDKIGTMQRPPTVQMTYDGKPLYTFVKDRKPGQITGNGVTSFEGKWYAVKPSGDPTD